MLFEKEKGRCGTWNMMIKADRMETALHLGLLKDDSVLLIVQNLNLGRHVAPQKAGQTFALPFKAKCYRMNKFSIDVPWANFERYIKSMIFKG